MDLIEMIPSILQLALLIVNIIVLIYIKNYVQKTTAIAESTEKHNAIISRPYVVAHITEKSHLKFILVRVQNHTAIHASVKILITRHVKDSNIPKGTASLIVSSRKQIGPFNGKNVWNVSAMDTVYVDTSLKDIERLLQDGHGEVLFDIRMKVSEFGKQVYRENPTIQYRWNNLSGKWEYNPLIEEYGPTEAV